MAPSADHFTLQTFQSVPSTSSRSTPCGLRAKGMLDFPQSKVQGSSEEGCYTRTSIIYAYLFLSSKSCLPIIFTLHIFMSFLVVMASCSKSRPNNQTMPIFTTTSRNVPFRTPRFGPRRVLRGREGSVEGCEGGCQGFNYFHLASQRRKFEGSIHSAKVAMFEHLCRDPALIGGGERLPPAKKTHTALLEPMCMGASP